MRKIANTHELAGELERILDYAGSVRPSRAVLASELNALSMKVATTSPSSLEKIYREIVEFGKSYKALEQKLDQAVTEIRDLEKQGKVKGLSSMRLSGVVEDQLFRLRKGHNQDAQEAAERLLKRWDNVASAFGE